MRTGFHDQLAALTETLSQMCGLAGAAMERATQALLQADLVLAEQVITNHDELSRMQTQAEEAAFILLALQAPVAGDLRLVVGSMQNVADAERMADWRYTSPKSLVADTPSMPCPKRCVGTSPRWARSRWTSATAPRRLCSRMTPRRRLGSAGTTTQWTTCTSTCSLS